MSDQSKIPKPLPVPKGKSVQSYPLAPVDGFVLSRIDGTMSVREIVTLTGLDNVAVIASIDKLVSLGLVELGPLPAAPRSLPPSQKEVKRSPSIPARPITEVSGVLATGIPKPPPALYDPAEIDEDVDLDRDHRRKILDLFYKLGDLDHYELLGVERGTEKKGLKRAYYELASLHHPDRFFRKRLGSFKQKMEMVFSRVTEAHDTLTDKDRRAEYDAYLNAQSEARELEAQLTRRTSSPGMDRTDRPIPAPMISTPPISVAPPPQERTSGIQLSEQARRDALARRLLGGRSSGPPSRDGRETPATPVPAPDPDALRRHYEQKISAVREHMAKEHLLTADRAASAGDWVAATNAYRLAAQINPDDAELQRSLNDAQRKANEVLGEAYRKQATYEEKAGKMFEAARSWQRVVKALPDEPEPHARAAACMLAANADQRGNADQANLRLAATLAQRAIALEPQHVKHRTLLAEIYLAAGLSLNAKRELEAAARLAPDDANIASLLKRAGGKG